MNIFIILVAIIWGIRILANVLSYIHLWFVKEYRIDRMLIHLRTNQGKRILFLSFRRPPVSPKAILLTIGTLVVLLLLFLYMPFFVLLKLLLIDILSFPITFVLVLVTRAPTFVYHQLVIRAAVAKLRSHKKMTVVGITGSYGKTSTKDFLATILVREFRVMKTEASKNAPIGIAEAVLKNLEPNDQIFVVEMGAYKRGEIAEMTRMVMPEIAILTAINPQHQDLFGSLENTKKAKYELVSGLVGRKLVICNADTEGTRDMGKRAVSDGYIVWWYTTKEGPVGKIESSREGKIFYAQGVQSDTHGIVFTCRVGNDRVSVQSSVLGEHQVSNILAAIAAAVACGMDLTDAARAASNINPTPKVMQLIQGINGSTYINDTFNNNPDAALAALNFLAQFRGKKFLVFQPMIELGSFSDSSHRRVGEQAGKTCEVIIVTNHNFYSSFEEGVRKSSKTIPLMALSPSRASEYLEKNVQKGDVVLFKGKEAETIFRRLR
ncbi:UDP-N-acetylmuramoyl-tripeptide--D-alanyl-D-alanine ligase [Candidatus Gottesmanbacteria bacterium]|nr:UDP-N-acetylmuramoyl-tripeptide--D-alanyl-D-alanine ligase [Candidatus Gottesmanbacteria bacterium]